MELKITNEILIYFRASISSHKKNYLVLLEYSHTLNEYLFFLL